MSVARRWRQDALGVAPGVITRIFSPDEPMTSHRLRVRRADYGDARPLLLTAKAYRGGVKDGAGVRRADHLSKLSRPTGR
jgi:hypothetical protein